MNLLETKIPYPENQYPVLKKLDHSDREIISWYAEKYNQFSCEFSFPSLYLWDDIYHYKLSFFNNWLIVFDTRYDYILMPMGEDISLSGLLTLSTSLKQDGYSGNISNVPPEIIERHPELSHYYDIENERGLAEYIYSTEKLYTLRGKKLRKKKNHISQFVRQYPDYQVKDMNPGVRADCLDMVKNMLATSESVSKTLKQENITIQKAFESFDLIPLEGIAIYTGTREAANEKKEKKEREESKLVAFAVYSRLNKEVFTIHFEKADYSYRGSAQVINWETARLLKDRCKYINREQDLGLEGLRRAKLSYDPEIICPANFLSFRG